MKGALIAGLVAVAFGGAHSAPSLAQAKEPFPGAVVSASKAETVPNGASAIVGSRAPSASASSLQGNAGAPDSGVVSANTNTSEKARSN
jgi:hypothetical protein